MRIQWRKSHDHLFYSCSFSSCLWNQICSKSNLICNKICLGWIEFHGWLKKKESSAKRTIRAVNKWDRHERGHGTSVGGGSLTSEREVRPMSWQVSWWKASPWQFSPTRECRCPHRLCFLITSRSASNCCPIQQNGITPVMTLIELPPNVDTPNAQPMDSAWNSSHLLHLHFE